MVVAFTHRCFLGTGSGNGLGFMDFAIRRLSDVK